MLLNPLLTKDIIELSDKANPPQAKLVRPSSFPEAQVITAVTHSHNFLAENHSTNEVRLWFVIFLCAASMIIEIVCGVMFGSLALIADGLHMSTHALAFFISALAYSVARKYADDPRFVFGTGKVGELAGYTCAIILIIIALYILYDGINRFINLTKIHYMKALPIAFVGLTVNILSGLLLSISMEKKDKDSNPSMQIMAHGHSHGHGQSHGQAKETYFDYNAFREDEDDEEDHHDIEAHDHGHEHQHGNNIKKSSHHPESIQKIKAYSDHEKHHNHASSEDHGHDHGHQMSHKHDEHKHEDEHQRGHGHASDDDHDDEHQHGHGHASDDDHDDEHQHGHGHASDDDHDDDHHHDRHGHVDTPQTTHSHDNDDDDDHHNEEGHQDRQKEDDHDHSNAKFQHDNNFRAAFVHVIADAVVSVMVIVALVIVGNVPDCFLRSFDGLHWIFGHFILGLSIDS